MAKLSKPSHGGKRTGAGRKPALFPVFIKKFRASELERVRFNAHMTGDARKDFLLVLKALDALMINGFIERQNDR